jgi:hypothetical protein
MIDEEIKGCYQLQKGIYVNSHGESFCMLDGRYVVIHVGGQYRVFAFGRPNSSLMGCSPNASFISLNRDGKLTSVNCLTNTGSNSTILQSHPRQTMVSECTALILIHSILFPLGR